MTLIEKEAILTALTAVAKLQRLVQVLAIHQEPTDAEWKAAADCVSTLIALSGKINSEMVKEAYSTAN
jgi:hypothetical protein